MEIDQERGAGSPMVPLPAKDSVKVEERIRNRVTAFSDTHIMDGMSPEHAFTPWFLHSKFKISPTEAIASSSDGKDDLGIDGFCLEKEAQKPRLWIIQAKFTAQYQGIISGIEDLIRGISVVTDLMQTGDTLRARENRVVVNLRRTLDGLTAKERNGLQVRYVLVHLYDADQELWISKPKVMDLIEKFKRAAAEHGLAGRADLDFMGPDRLDFRAAVVPKPAEPATLRFKGLSIDVGEARCWFGIGHLADLVNLYDRYRTELFAHNVRMYLYRQAEKEQGAARQIRKTLEDICSSKNGDGMNPDQFTVMHNGVTLWANSLSTKDENQVSLEPGHRGIYVLNGCQTIYTAWNLREKKGKDGDGWLDRWDEVQVPIRILLTDNDRLVRTVTVSTNRQNQIPPSAFWTHDSTQLHLDRQLRHMGIFYERQEGAYLHLSRSDPRAMEAFVNTETPITMENIGRAIAGADRSLPLGLAASPKQIFETESHYKRVFSEKHLRWPRFLVLLVNLFQATRLALRDIRNNSGETSELKWLKPGSLGVPTFRLLVQYIGWQYQRGEITAEELAPFAQTSFSTRTGGMREMKEWTRKQLRHQNSGIEQQLKKHYWDADAGKWTGYTDKRRLEAALSRWWAAADPFADWTELTQMTPDDEVG